MATEAITNGGFESGNAGWNGTFYVYAGNNTTYIHSGNMSGYGDSTQSAIQNLLSKNVHCDRITDFSFYYLVGTPNSVPTIVVTFYDDIQNSTYGLEHGHAVNTWIKIDLTDWIHLYGDKQIKEIAIFPNYESSVENGYIDDVSITYTVPPPVIPSNTTVGLSSPAIPSILIRVKEIEIGPENGNVYTWYGIKKVTFEDTNPWVHIEIPAGPMVHQHLHSIHYEGTITVADLGSLYRALFETPIDENNHTAIHPNTNVRYSVDYLAIHFIEHDGTEYTILLDGFKVNKIRCVNVELGTEALWEVTFTADMVSYP